MYSLVKQGLAVVMTLYFESGKTEKGQFQENVCLFVC